MHQTKLFPPRILTIITSASFPWPSATLVPQPVAQHGSSIFILFLASSTLESWAIKHGNKFHEGKGDYANVKAGLIKLLL